MYWISGWWLVRPTPLKNHGVEVSYSVRMMTFPINDGKNNPTVANHQPDYPLENDQFIVETRLPTPIWQGLC